MEVTSNPTTVRPRATAGKAKGQAKETAEQRDERLTRQRKKQAGERLMRRRERKVEETVEQRDDRLNLPEKLGELVACQLAHSLGCNDPKEGSGLEEADLQPVECRL